MNFPKKGPKFHGEKGNSLGEQCTFMKEGLKFHEEKGSFPEEQCIFFRERPKFPGEQSCFESFRNHNHLWFILYKLVTYHWKGFKEGYKLCS